METVVKEHKYTIRQCPICPNKGLLPPAGGGMLGRCGLALPTCGKAVGAWVQGCGGTMRAAGGGAPPLCMCMHPGCYLAMCMY